MSAEGQKNIMVDRRVVGVEELESGVTFLKIFYGTIFFRQRTIFLQKIFFLIRIDRRVIGVEESESVITFLKLYQ
jgi:hypothetical protein